MRNLSMLVFLFCCSVQLTFAQGPAKDTLIPPQHKDTIKSEPKLKGGALIDTINTKDKMFQHQPLHPDTSLHKTDTLGFMQRGTGSGIQ